LKARPKRFFFASASKECPRRTNWRFSWFQFSSFRWLCKRLYSYTPTRCA